MPVLTPVTTPDPLTLTLPAPALHMPPVVASLSVVVAPAHRLPAPVMAAGDALTVMVVVAVQPLPRE